VSYGCDRLWLLFVTGGRGRPMREHHLPSAFEIEPYERALFLRVGKTRGERSDPIFDITPGIPGAVRS